MTNNKHGSFGLVALLMTGGLAGLLATPVVAACSDTADWNGDMGCDIDCSDGDHFGVTGSADGDVWGAMECGGGNAGCGGVNECVPSSYGVASMSGDGNCYGNGNDGRISCAITQGADTSIVMELVASLLEGGIDCPTFEAMALDAGAKWVQVKDVEPVGPGVTVFAWSVQAGCVDVPEVPTLNLLRVLLTALQNVIDSIQIDQQDCDDPSPPVTCTLY